MATKGTGAIPARELGQGWKVSPSIEIAGGETVTLADIGSRPRAAIGCITWRRSSGAGLGGGGTDVLIRLVREADGIDHWARRVVGRFDVLRRCVELDNQCCLTG